MELIFFEIISCILVLSCINDIKVNQCLKMTQRNLMSSFTLARQQQQQQRNVSDDLIDLRMELTYTPELSFSKDRNEPYSEHTPSIHAYLTHMQEDTRQIVQFPLLSYDSPDKQAQSDTQSVRVKGSVRRWATGMAVGFTAYCWTTTPEGNECKQEAGAAKIPLVAIYENVVKTGREKTFALKLTVRTDNSFEKGRLNVRITPDWIRALDGEKLERLTRIATAEAYGKEEYRVEKLMLNLEKRSLEVYRKKYKPTNDLVVRVHCPEFKTHFSEIPGSSYVFSVPLVGTSEEVFDNILQIALDRAGVKRSDFIRVAQGQLSARNKGSSDWDYRFHNITRIIADMLCIFATSLYYMSDFVDESRSKRGKSVHFQRGSVREVEFFKILRIVLGDDCEGLAREIYMEIDEILALRNVQSDAMRLVQQVLELYVPCLTLGAVTMRALSLAGGTLKKDDVIAHIYTVLIPRHLFQERLIYTAGPELTPHACEFPITKEDLDVREWETHLEIMICEGTGMLDPWVKPLVDYYDATHRDIGLRAEKALVHTQETRFDLEGRSSQLSQLAAAKVYQLARDDSAFKGRDESDFYKMVSCLWTDYFLRRGQHVSDFALVYESRKTYSVTFHDFINQASDMKIVPVIEWTQEQEECIEDILDEEEPLPRLVAINSGTRQRIKRDVDNILGSLVSGKQTGDQSFRYHIRHDKLVQRRQDTVSAIQEYVTDKRVKGFTYQIQYVGVSAAAPEVPIAVVDLVFFI